MNRIRTGILGFGKQGERFARHILEEIPDIELLAICRRSAEGAQYASRHGLGFFDRCDDILSNNRLKALIIASPSSLHAEHIIKSLKKNKHVFVDKPVLMDMSASSEICSLAGRKDLTVAVNYCLRADVLTMYLKEKMAGIKGLKKVSINISRPFPSHRIWEEDLRSKAGLIWDLGSHAFDLAYYLLGYPGWDQLEVSSADIPDGSDVFVKGMCGKIEMALTLSWSSGKRDTSVRMEGDSGTVTADYIARKVLSGEENKGFPCYSTYVFMLRNFAESILYGGRVRCSLEEALISASLCAESADKINMIS